MVGHGFSQWSTYCQNVTPLWQNASVKESAAKRQSDMIIQTYSAISAVSS